jgi:predicted metal-binding protein
MTETRPCLHVCVTCRAGAALIEGEAPPGARLHAALAARLDAMAAPPVRLREVVCLASCERGCAAAISMPGKWSYLLGDLAPGLAADLLDYAAAYRASATGTIMPSRRPASLKTMILARFPAQDLAMQEAAE